MMDAELEKTLKGLVGLVGMLIPTETEREQEKTEETKYVLASNLRVGDEIFFVEYGSHRVRAIEEYGDDAQLTLTLLGSGLTSVVVYKNYMVEVLTPTEV